MLPWLRLVLVEVLAFAAVAWLIVGCSREPSGPTGIPDVSGVELHLHDQWGQDVIWPRCWSVERLYQSSVPWASWTETAETIEECGLTVRIEVKYAVSYPGAEPESTVAWQLERTPWWVEGCGDLSP